MWSKWKYGCAAFVSMFSGATLVHNIYKPNLEIPETPPDVRSAPAPAGFVTLKENVDIVKPFSK